MIDIHRLIVAASTAAFLASAPAVFGDDADFDVGLAKQGTQLVRQYCKKCHGDDDAYPGLDVADRATLIDPIIEDEEPFIVAGNAGESRVWVAMEEKYMPPEDQPQPSAQELAVIKRWIEAGAHFPPEDRLQRDFIAEETVLQLIASDLDEREDDEIPFTRYFSLAHLWNDTSGREPTTEEDLRMLRAAVSKLVNSLSSKSRIVRPRVVDAQTGTLLAIDLRDYGWDTWHWNQVLTTYPYGLKTSSKQATKIYRITGTRIPYLRADWFVNGASRPPLYYDLLRIPRNAKALEASLGVNIQHNFDTGQLARAAFQDSVISEQNRMVERHDTTTGGRYYWKSYDIKPGAGESGDFTRRPLGPRFEDVKAQLAVFAHDGGEIIYSLTNGLQAYMLVDGEDVRIDTGPPTVVSDKNRFAGNNLIVNGISCMGCHKEGMIPWEKDNIRPLYLNRRNQKVGSKVLQLFPPDREMRSLVRRDREFFMLALTESVGEFLQAGDDKDKAIKDFPDPITKSARRYYREVDAETAARELGVEMSRLQALASLARFQSLGLGNFANGGTIARDNWEKAYGATARELGLGVPIRPR